jgi:hypothetical protein
MTILDGFDPCVLDGAKSGGMEIHNNFLRGVFIIHIVHCSLWWLRQVDTSYACYWSLPPERIVELLFFTVTMMAVKVMSHPLSIFFQQTVINGAINLG